MLEKEKRKKMCLEKYLFAVGYKKIKSRNNFTRAQGTFVTYFVLI